MKIYKIFKRQIVIKIEEAKVKKIQYMYTQKPTMEQNAKKFNLMINYEINKNSKLQPEQPTEKNTLI